MTIDPRIESGASRKDTMLPYGRQSLDEDDIAAVVEVLRSDWLTTGPKVTQFERTFAESVGTDEAVAVSNGTAALHAAIYALGIRAGDEVIVPAMTFAASANCVVYQGATPIFADVEPDTLLLDPAAAEAKISPRTKAILAVDYAGQPCDYDRLRTLADKYGLSLIDDACHALGGSYKDRSVGTLADVSTFSFHPVKHICTGEGGMIATDNRVLAARMRAFRNHGITTDHMQREQQGLWFYEMVDLGYNYRITDFQCALGISQLKKLDGWVARRQEIARRYDSELLSVYGIRPLTSRREIKHAYHLYVIRLDSAVLKKSRWEIFGQLRQHGIGVQVHYIPVHLHPFYRQHFGTGLGLCPVAETAYEEILSLPNFPRMTNRDVDRVVNSIKEIIE